MGNVCCEGSTQIGNIDIMPREALSFQPCKPMVITNRVVQETLDEFKNNPLVETHESEIGTRLRSPHRETTKNFIYEGTWKDELPSGYGRIKFQNDEYFEGQFKNGVAEGKGRYIFANGDYFQGDIKGNKAQGEGKYSGSQMEYQGEWSDSKPTIGKYFLRKNSTHVFIDNGNQGRIVWLNGNKYEGEIEDLVPHGHGKMIFDNENVYDGDWKNGVFQGYGTFLWANGKVYKGHYLNGVKHGRGEYIYSSTRRYQGDWKNGKQNGNGKLFQNQVLIVDGVFEDGVPSPSPSSVETQKLNTLTTTQDIFVVPAAEPLSLKATQVVAPEPRRLTHSNDQSYNTYEVK